MECVLLVRFLDNYIILLYNNNKEFNLIQKGPKKGDFFSSFFWCQVYWLETTGKQQEVRLPLLPTKVCRLFPQPLQRSFGHFIRYPDSDEKNQQKALRASLLVYYSFTVM